MAHSRYATAEHVKIGLQRGTHFDLLLLAANGYMSFFPTTAIPNSFNWRSLTGVGAPSEKDPLKQNRLEWGTGTQIRSFKESEHVA